MVPITSISPPSFHYFAVISTRYQHPQSLRQHDEPDLSQIPESRIILLVGRIHFCLKDAEKRHRSRLLTIS